jgi:iron complex outermembrane receptor protein
MFKNNKIMQLWLLSMATVSVAARQNEEETITVTQGSAKNPPRP